MKQTKKRYWISWYQTTEDMRPLTYPPNKNVLAWWCSGSRCSDDAYTLCALVDAASHADAELFIKKDWPEANEWRFNEEKPADWLPSDRFPVDKDWERQRLHLESA